MLAILSVVTLCFHFNEAGIMKMNMFKICDINSSIDPRAGCMILPQYTLSPDELLQYDKLFNAMYLHCFKKRKNTKIIYDESNSKFNKINRNTAILSGNKIIQISISCKSALRLQLLMLPLLHINLTQRLNILARQNLMFIKRDSADVIQATGKMPSKRKYAVYTSSQNLHNIESRWLCPERHFDIIINKYKNIDMGKLIGESTYYRTNASKWQSLYVIFHENILLFSQYSYVAVWDDDIEISCSQINELFEMSMLKMVWIAQPAFTSDSRITHEITRQRYDIDFAYTSFIEMNAPIFQTSMLERFLSYYLYDGTLYGYGIDYLYHHLFGARYRDFIIFHNISCRNPFEIEKTGAKREISKLASDAVRQRQWQHLSRLHKISATPKIVYQTFKKMSW